MKKKIDLQGIAYFFFEMGTLAKTPRSFSGFLGSGNQSVAEHIHRVTMVGYTLAMMSGDVDVTKVLKMCLFHDITESRISDLNYVHQKYTERKEKKAMEDLADSFPFGHDIVEILEEYELRKSKESQLVKDADNLELLLTLKEQMDIGNIRAKEWTVSTIQRLKTEEGKALAEVIMKTESSEWWFGNKNDAWWVNRNKE